MFKNSFSFNGRIGRLEFGISFILFWIFLCLATYLASIYIPDFDARYFIAILLPALWFRIAQATKRCHDIGKDGWNQLYPFYFWTLLTEDSHWGPNEYGLNPKGIGNNEPPDNI